jgi:rhomboid family GlyGly-CTERM serine protease
MVAVSRWHDAGFPGITLIVALGCLVFYIVPEITIWTIYDREQVLHGEIWRLMTGHSVHFSWSHLVFNLSVFAVAGYLLERHYRGTYLWLLILTTLTSSLYFLIFIPDMARYGGLSGLVSAIVVYLSLSKIRAKVRGYYIWVLILVLFLFKVGYEIISVDAVFASSSDSDFNVVPAAHIIGAVIAVLFFIYKEAGKKMVTTTGM